MPHIPLWYGLCSCFYLKILGFILVVVLVCCLCLKRSLPSDTRWVKFLRCAGWVWVVQVCFTAVFVLAIVWKWYSNLQIRSGDPWLLWLGIMFGHWDDLWSGVFFNIILMSFVLVPGLAALFAAGRLRLEQKKEI